jgi:hypothetical protein
MLLPPCLLEGETDPQTTIWELLLPEQAKRLPTELARVDAYLDDVRFIAPWRGLFSPGGWAARRYRSTRCCGCCTDVERHVNATICLVDGVIRHR